MEFEIKEEFIKEHGLNEAQVAALRTFGSDYIAEQKKSWDDKVKEEGNIYANGILDGAAKALEETTKITRNKGEKIADYTTRATTTYLSTKTSELETLKAEYAEKIKNGGSDEAMKAELTTLKAEVDRLKKVEADFEPLKGVKEQYDEMEKKYGSLKLETAFTSARPSFPDTVNVYEADAKWNAFKNSVLEKYNIEIVDGVAMAIDKENAHKQSKLSDLAAKDKELSELTKGREQPGSGAKPAGTETVEGVPFKVDFSASSTDRAAAIREYLTKEKKLSVVSDEYAKLFSEYNKKIIAAANK